MEEALGIALQAHNMKVCQLDLTLYPEKPAGRRISGTGLSKPVPCDLGGDKLDARDSLEKRDFLRRLLTNLLEAFFEINKQLQCAEILIQIPGVEETLCIEFTSRLRRVALYFLENAVFRKCPECVLEDAFRFSRAVMPGEYGRLVGHWDDRTRQAQIGGFLERMDSVEREDIRGLSEWVRDLRSLKRPWSGAFFLRTNGTQRLEGRCEIVFSKVRWENLPALSRGVVSAAAMYGAPRHFQLHESDPGASASSKRQRVG